MTREEALFELGENFNDKELGFVNNIQLICKIFNDHETAIEILIKANEEEISRHFNECEKHEAQLKAKDERIVELEQAMKPKTCAGCLFGKITLNSVICGKSGTYKEYDDYCKYHWRKKKG